MKLNMFEVIFAICFTVQNVSADTLKLYIKYVGTTADILKLYIKCVGTNTMAKIDKLKQKISIL